MKINKPKIDKRRYILKTITWRLIASAFTIILIWLFTNNWELSLGLGGVEIVGKMILYYTHERIWYKYSDFGVKKN